MTLNLEQRVYKTTLVEKEIQTNSIFVMFQVHVISKFQCINTQTAEKQIAP